MDFDTFLTIAWLVLLAVSIIGCKISSEIVYVQRRDKRYVKPPKKERGRK